MPWTGTLLLLLVPLLFTFTAGCGRFPATPKPTTEATLTTTTAPFTHKLECTEAEVNKSACLNGGTCYALEIGGLRDAYCSCPRTYLPPRCQNIDPSIFGNDYQSPAPVASASIAASVVAVILFVTVLVCIVVWRRRYLKRKNAESKTQNGTNGSLINGVDDHGSMNKDKPPDEDEYPKNDISNGHGKLVYRDSINLSDHFPFHRNSSGPLTGAPPQEVISHSDRPKSYDSNYTDRFPPSDPRSSRYDPYPDIQFVDEDAEDISKNLLSQN